MERAEGLFEKTKVVCSICQDEFSYHRSSSCLSYHLNAKHLTESSPRLDGRQPTLHDFSRKLTRPVRARVTIRVANDCRPINIVEDSGLIEVIRIASWMHLSDVMDAQYWLLLCHRCSLIVGCIPKDRPLFCPSPLLLGWRVDVTSNSTPCLSGELGNYTYIYPL